CCLQALLESAARVAGGYPRSKRIQPACECISVLADVVPAKDQTAVMRRILSGSLPELAMANYYFQFYVTRAIDPPGVEELYLGTLLPWRQMLSQGLTTTPEYPDPSRSDTHAWSAHPAYDLTTMVAGIRPAAPGFASVRIRPSLGDLTLVDA